MLIIIAVQTDWRSVCTYPKQSPSTTPSSQDIPYSPTSEHPRIKVNHYPEFRKV